MAFLPVAVGAIGTVAQMTAQAGAASAQRQALREQQSAQQQQFELQQRRFQYSKDQAAQMYMREAVVAEEMRHTAMNQFEMAKSQQALANIYEETNASIQDTNLRNQTQRLLATASSTEGAASLNNANLYQQLKASLGNDEQATNAFLQRMAAMGLTGESAQPTQQAFLLNSIDNYQRSLTAANTTSRVAGFQAEALRDEANITDSYRELTTNFMNTQRQLSQSFQKVVNERMPTLLELQHQRNMVGLDAASKLRQAEMSLGQQASMIGNRANQSALSAQINSLPSTFGTVLGGLTGVASQVVPFILSNRNQQSIFQNQPAASSNPQYPAPLEFGQPLPRDNRMQDVTGRIYV